MYLSHKYYRLRFIYSVYFHRGKLLHGQNEEKGGGGGGGEEEPQTNSETV